MKSLEYGNRVWDLPWVLLVGPLKERKGMYAKPPREASQPASPYGFEAGARWKKWCQPVNSFELDLGWVVRMRSCLKNGTEETAAGKQPFLELGLGYSKMDGS